MSPDGSQTLPLLALLEAVAERQAAAMPPVALPGGQLTVRRIQLLPEGAVVSLAGKGPLGLATAGTVTVRVTAVGREQASLALHADGGLAFRSLVNAALTAGGLMEPLLRSLLGRPLRRGVEMHGGQLRLSYAELLDGLPEAAPGR